MLETHTIQVKNKDIENLKYIKNVINTEKDKIIKDIAKKYNLDINYIIQKLKN